MRIELAEGIYWVGAIDWNIRDFHGYTTPRGTTYNAYLIVDEKVALVDTVKAEFAEEMLGRIGEIIDPGEIDYVVSNHAEGDHSGAMAKVLEVARDAQVVATARGKDALLKHYKMDWPTTTVKTGETLGLGKTHLRFIEAPMLHWPDSMFTYVAEKKILLPNDAFGQHMATAERFEDEVEGGLVMEEAAKYYANILMPFGPLITKQLEKLCEMGVEVETIAPSHGLIWRRDPGRILEAYRRWAQAETKEKVLVIYDTMWGTTERMARTIAEDLAKEVEVKLFNLRRTDYSEVVREVLDARAVLVGSPTLNGGMFWTVGGFLTYLKGLRPRGRIGAAFGSYGWGRGAVKAINKELKEAGMEVLEPGLEVKYRPDEGELQECRSFCSKFLEMVKAPKAPIG